MSFTFSLPKRLDVQKYYDKWTTTVMQLSRPQRVYIWTSLCYNMLVIHQMQGMQKILDSNDL